MAVYCAVGAIRCVMADDVDAQSDDDGGRWGNPMGDGGRWGEGTVGGVGRSVNVKVGGKCLL